MSSICPNLGTKHDDFLPNEKNTSGEVMFIILGQLLSLPLIMQEKIEGQNGPRINGVIFLARDRVNTQ